MTAEWTSDEDKIVLEVQKEDKKTPEDSEIDTWREILKDMEESEFGDVTINSHDLIRPNMQGLLADVFAAALKMYCFSQCRVAYYYVNLSTQVTTSTRFPPRRRMNFGSLGVHQTRAA